MTTNHSFGMIKILELPLGDGMNAYRFHITHLRDTEYIC